MFHASRLAPDLYLLRLPRSAAFRVASRTSPQKPPFAPPSACGVVVPGRLVTRPAHQLGAIAALRLDASSWCRAGLGVPGAVWIGSGRWALALPGAVVLGWPGRAGSRQGGRPENGGAGGRAKRGAVSSSLSRTPQTPNFPSYYISASGSAQRLQRSTYYKIYPAKKFS